MQAIKLLIFDWEGTLMCSNRQLFLGVKEMLLTLKEKYLLAIATNRYRSSLDKLLKEFHLEKMFNASRCADETRPKPDTQMLEELLLELDINADEALMIGDSESDMIMAAKLNMPRISVGPRHLVSELLRHHPIAHVSIVTELIAVLLPSP